MSGGGTKRRPGGDTFLEELFELGGELLAHLWLGEVVLEEGEDILGEGGRFCVAAGGGSAGDGEEGGDGHGAERADEPWLEVLRGGRVEEHALHWQRFQAKDSIKHD